MTWVTYLQAMGGKIPVLLLDHMYEEFKRKDIVLWCYAVTDKNKVNDSDKPKAAAQKRPRANDGEKPKSKRDACMNKIQEVEDIVGELRKKHGNALNLERYNAWAHMLHTGQYSSYDEPPNFPYFKMPGSKSFKSTSVANDAEKSQAMSPGKRIHRRGECIQQLDQWFHLLEKGVISKEQYEELKASILGDIGNM